MHNLLGTKKKKKNIVVYEIPSLTSTVSPSLSSRAVATSNAVEAVASTSTQVSSVSTLSKNSTVKSTSSQGVVEKPSSRVLLAISTSNQGSAISTSSQGSTAKGASRVLTHAAPMTTRASQSNQNKIEEAASTSTPARKTKSTTKPVKGECTESDENATPNSLEYSKVYSNYTTSWRKNRCKLFIYILLIFL